MLTYQFTVTMAVSGICPPDIADVAEDINQELTNRWPHRSVKTTVCDASPTGTEKASV